MMDRRLTPSNGRVAATSLQGLVSADTFVDGTPATVTTAVLDINQAPDWSRERQVLLGAQVTVYEALNGHAFVQAADRYVGYVDATALGDVTEPTHSVATPATHAYEAEDFKSRDLIRLPFGCKVTVIDERRKFFETDQGFIPKKHLRPVDHPFSDPATVAQMHFGVPYLWGGNSMLGLDCSGLVSAALSACGVDCLGDADLQETSLGNDIAPDAPLMRGDILFWKGHVGMMVDTDTLIHANAHHMAVSYEPVEKAILRIKAQGDGPVTSRKRL